MSVLFKTQPDLNPENTPSKQDSKDIQLTVLNGQVSQYVDTLPTKIDTTFLNQLNGLKNKHVYLGGMLSALHLEKSLVLKQSQKRVAELKGSFEYNLTKEVETFKDHKEFFRKHFASFSCKLREAREKRDRLALQAEDLRKTLYQVKNTNITQQTQRRGVPTIIPLLPTVKTSKTLRSTEQTERSIRMSTDMAEPQSPILMRMGGSQPLLSSRIYQPIKAMSSIKKKAQRRGKMQLLREMLQQRLKQKKQSEREGFQQVLFHRRNFGKLMAFLQGLQPS